MKITREALLDRLEQWFGERFRRWAEDQSIIGWAVFILIVVTAVWSAVTGNWGGRIDPLYGDGGQREYYEELRREEFIREIREGRDL